MMSRILCEISFLQYVPRPWTALKTSMKNDGAKNLDKIPSAAFIIIGLKRRFETFDKWLKNLTRYLDFQHRGPFS